METIAIIALITLLAILLIYIYFTPYRIAARRNHRNLTLIFLINLLTGYTAIGWFVALFWALFRTSNDDIERKPCHSCGELIAVDATVCRFCSSSIEGKEKAGKVIIHRQETIPY